MNTFITSAIALTAVSASAFATDNGWVSLDQEINNLNASLAAQNATGPKLGGWIQARYENSSDIQVVDPSAGGGGGGALAPGTSVTHDLSGFRLSSVRVELSGDAGSGYSYKVSFDLASGAALLQDAYAQFKLGDQVTGKIGLFKPDFLRSSTVDDNKTVLLDRTIIGSGHEWNDRDAGLEVGFTYDMLRASVSVLNGSDLEGKELALCAKVAVNLMGGGVGKVEGAYGAPEAMALSAGLSYRDDANLDKATTIGFEVEMTAGAFSLAGEMVQLDTNNFIDFGPAGALTTSDSTPWDVTGSYLFSEHWEGVARYENPDDADNSNQMSFGVNYLVSGHDIKWTAEYAALSTDNVLGDVSVISLGISVSM